MTYMGLLLLKLRAVELEGQIFDCKLVYLLGKTVQDIWQIVSSQVTSGK